MRDGEISESFKNWTRDVLEDSQIPIFDYYSKNSTENATENQLFCALSNFLCKNSGSISQSRSGGNLINNRIRSSKGCLLKNILYEHIFSVRMHFGANKNFHLDRPKSEK